mgnify:CR=1 FL=1
MRSFSTSSNSSSSSSSGGVIRNLLHRSYLRLSFKSLSLAILFAFKGGKYLAGDSGVTFDFSRRFKSGLVTGVFFSLTDISKREFGEGSFDKGFYFTIPIDAFTSKYNKRFFSWGLKPLTRDGAAILSHGFHLYGVTEQAQHETYFRDKDDIYD